MIKFRGNETKFSNIIELLMTTCYQLDLFESNDPITLIQKDFRLLDKKCQNVQRGLFARYATLQEEVESLRDLCYKMRIELDDLKGKNRAEVIEFHVETLKK